MHRFAHLMLIHRFISRQRAYIGEQPDHDNDQCHQYGVGLQQEAGRQVSPAHFQAKQERLLR